MKKIFFWSFISIPIVMVILLLSLYFTNIWKPTVIAIVINSILLIIVGIFAVVYLQNSYRNFAKDDPGEFQYNIKQKFWKLGLIGFIADFCDTIGIGSFAISIVLLKLTKQVKNDKQLLGTLNVGHAIPTCLQAIIFISLVKVEWITLILLITSAAIGAYIGAFLVNKIKLGWTQILLGVALIIISIIILLGQKEVHVMPSARTSDSLEVWWKYLLGSMIFFYIRNSTIIRGRNLCASNGGNIFNGLKFIMCLPNYDGISSLFNAHRGLSFY
ncbi:MULTISPECIES: TSUP family transporter [Spiroplasma]|uniref:TSUP family transporter n=1 Tax=Spiroplasma TaxID=2132 RepID=UPI001E37F8E1|nr:MULTISPECIES: TSUP family transporter [Spiroplasma]UNF61696.1 sulfite exporter TauE/SafE family protein [Spiroplasma poulsonii]